jgi:deoxyhypusine synthase
MIRIDVKDLLIGSHKMRMEDLVPIKDFDSPDGIRGLTRQMRESGGYTAKKLGVACDILEEMVADKDCTRILSFPASLVATGTRGLLRELLKRKLFDAVVTTCGTMDHDLARVWRDYYHGSFLMDDADLHRRGINREGNVLIPNDSYGVILEEKMQPILKELYDSGKRDLAPHELAWEFGKRLEKEKNARDSLAYWAWKNQIPVFIPGPTDGAWGWQMWMFWQDSHKDFNINLMKEEQKISDLVHGAKRTGALMIGGGISKHHTIWWNQFRDGLDYAVYVTTAPEWDGSLSGAQLREAVSWGKVNEKAKYVTVEGEATVLLPLMVAPLLKG